MPHAVPHTAATSSLCHKRCPNANSMYIYICIVLYLSPAVCVTILWQFRVETGGNYLRLCEMAAHSTCGATKRCTNLSNISVMHTQASNSRSSCSSCSWGIQIKIVAFKWRVRGHRWALCHGSRLLSAKPKGNSVQVKYKKKKLNRWSAITKG